MLAERLHIARTPQEIAATIEWVARDPAQRRNFNLPTAMHSWRQRAERLLDIVSQVSEPTGAVR
jgi:hypothetical protein